MKIELVDREDYNNASLEYHSHAVRCNFRDLVEQERDDESKIINEAITQMVQFCQENFGVDYDHYNNRTATEYCLDTDYNLDNQQLPWSWYYVGSYQAVFWFTSKEDLDLFRETFEVYGKVAWS